SGVPQNPGGWILKVARNQALDVLRRNALLREKQNEIADRLELQMWRGDNDSPFADEQLSLMFACCDPHLPQDSQSALVLKALCGINIPEIARAVLTEPATIAQRLVRAKRKIREEKIRFELPDQNELSGRLDTVLEILHVMFNEGYSASQGEELIRKDVCDEAL